MSIDDLSDASADFADDITAEVAAVHTGEREVKPTRPKATYVLEKDMSYIISTSTWGPDSRWAPWAGGGCVAGGRKLGHLAGRRAAGRPAGPLGGIGGKLTPRGVKKSEVRTPKSPRSVIIDRAPNNY